MREEKALSNNYCLLRTWHLWYSWTKFSSTCLGAKLWTLLSIFPVVYCLIEMGSPKYIWTFPKSSFKIFLAFNKACKKPKRNEISTCLYLFKYIPMYNMKELHPTHIPKVFQYWCSLNVEKKRSFNIYTLWNHLNSIWPNLFVCQCLVKVFRGHNIVIMFVKWIKNVFCNLLEMLFYGWGVPTKSKTKLSHHISWQFYSIQQTSTDPCWFFGFRNSK